MKADIAIAEGRMDAELAESREDFETAVRTQVRGLEARIDELRVRAALARMEVRDRMDPLLDGVKDSFGLAIARLHWPPRRTRPGRRCAPASRSLSTCSRRPVEEAADELD